MSSAEESPRKIRTFIYGSCVSRDTFEYLPQDKFELVGYTARQSIISAFAPADQLSSRFDGLSRFSARMLRNDAVSSLVPDIEQSAPDIDLLLIDLIDERLGVHLGADGGVLTRSVESIAVGIDSERERAMKQLPFGFDQHFACWASSITRFAAVLSELDLTRRTLLLASPWAEIDVAGNPSPASFGVPAAEANRNYERYCQWLRDRLGIRMVSLPTSTVRSDPGHKWGPAPFHYDTSSYRRLASSIQALHSKLQLGSRNGVE